jgi:pyruvate dehydrogenase E1 component
VLAALLRDKQIAKHIVPIVPDESRTFGMEGPFRQIGIYSPSGELYQPPGLSAAGVLQGGPARADARGGVTEAGSISSFIAAGTSYSNHGLPMVPFFIYYSMFGYQRVGDLVWARRTAARAASCSAGPPAARR